MPLRHGVAAVLAFAFACVAPSFADAQSPDDLTLYAAGSLKPAFTSLLAAFTAQSGIAVVPTFGSSGLLRSRIAGGERADVFASADLDNPRRLAQAGLTGPVDTFTHNRMCLLVTPAVAPGRAVDDIMLDPAIRLITSTPKADPAGDYAERIFARIDARRPGSLAALDAKALRLVGGTDAVPIPAGADKGAYLLLTAQRGDAFLAYCSGFVAAVTAHPADLRSLAMPPDLAVQADYGLAVRSGAPEAATRLRDFILSDRGQAILTGFGFSRN